MDKIFSTTTNKTELKGQTEKIDNHEEEMSENTQERTTEIGSVPDDSDSQEVSQGNEEQI